MATIQDLLTKVTLINNRYEIIDKHTGDNFNVFKIMRMEEDEVYTHSAIISELLNVKGSHNLGDIFLKVFIDCFNNNLQEDSKLLDIEDWQNSKAFVEVSIGLIDKDATEGGRIDILVKSDNKRIIFENKIKAPDQKNQLFRYHKYALSTGQEFWLIYLTKFPQNPEPITTNKNESVSNKTINLTYKDFIKDWIEKCIPLAFDKPLLRETLRQYLATVKRITNQSTNKEMEQGINDLIKNSKENFGASMLIANQFNAVKNEIIETFWINIKLELENIYSNEDYKFSFTKPLIERCPALFIEIAPNNIIGIEPLNGLHYKNGFNELFIGCFDANNTESDDTGPFSQWYNCEKLGYNFGDIEQTLGDILPNSSQREEIKSNIINKIKEFIQTNEASQPNTYTNL
ncbi:MAG: PD-(D/E)XK nuclease family protein [Flavobacterium sp.]|nr:PD-(D/E)XK nuclease family protein [Flavobacterium sp.]